MKDAFRAFKAVLAGSRPSAAPRGFTLVEMLVVVIIIFILAGILFRVISLVNQKTARAKCVYELEQIQNALNEYFAVYGCYPPVNTMHYEYESTNHQTRWFTWDFLPRHDDPGSPGHPPSSEFFADMDRSGSWPSPSRPGWALGYHYGLVSYLYARHRNGSAQRHWYDRDTDRDKEAKDRWYHFIDDIGPDGVGTRYHASPPGLETVAPYSNDVASLIDPWGKSYQYRCAPPYIRYRLWSNGPDGVEGTPDDVHRDSFSE